MISRCAVLLAVLGAVPAVDANIVTSVQTTSVSLQPAGKLSVPSGVALVSSGAAFSSYSGSTQLNYRARTSSSGSATITLQASGAFTPSGGPSLTSGQLTYTCSGATLGTGCSGTQTVSSSSQTSVVSIPSGVCMGGPGCSTPNPAQLNLLYQLENDPASPTGSCSVTVLLTISSL